MTKSNLKIIEALKSKNEQVVYERIIDLWLENPHSPLPHLYYGIQAEIDYRFPLAMRHYRAALALDGTCKAALDNLYRLGEGRKFPINYGEVK